jgi:hypothetical protein
MVGVAGTAATILVQDRAFEIHPFTIADLLDDPDIMSESDWRLAGLACNSVRTAAQTKAIVRTFELLRGPLWPLLLHEARKLIVTSQRNS